MNLGKRTIFFYGILVSLLVFLFIGCDRGPKVETIQVSPENKTIEIGQSINFKVKALSKEGQPIPNLSWNWSVEPKDVGTIDDQGTFRAKQPGQCTIKAAYKNNSGTASVRIEPKKVASLQINAEKTKAFPGSPIDLQVQALTKDGSPASYNQIEVSSPTPGLKLSSKQLKLGLQANATLQVTLSPEPGTNKIIFKSDQTVQDISLQGTTISRLSILPDKNEFQALETVDFKVIGSDQAGNKREVSVKWSLSGEKAKIQKDGQLKMLKPGQAVLIAEYKDLTQGHQFKIVPGQLDKIELEPKKISLKAGKTVTMKAIGKNQYGYALPTDINWSVTNKLGSISEGGLFLAQKEGQGQIKAQAHGVSATIPVQVKPGSLTDIRINLAKTKIEAGETIDLKATGLDAYGNQISIDPQWSLNKALGSIDHQKSTFSALQAGTGMLRTQTGNIFKTVELEVVPNKLHRLQIQPSNPTITAGQEITFQVKGFDQYDNLIQVSPSFSLKENLGQLNKAGTFKPIKAGNTMLTVKAGGITTTTTVAVVPAKMEKAIIKPSGPVKIKAGQVQEFSAFGLDPLGNVIFYKVDWAVSPKKLGQVDARGMFKAIKAGPGEIIASVQDIKTGQVQKVKASLSIDPGTPKRIVIKPEQVDLVAGEKKAFQAKVLDNYGNQLDVPVHWELENENVGHLSQNGMFKAIKAGNWDIIASADNLVAKAKVNISTANIAVHTIAPQELSLRAGEKKKLESVGEDSFGNIIKPKVVWKLTNEDLGFVTKDNSFVAKKQGHGFLVAIANNLVQRIPVKVDKGPLSKIQISHPGKEIISGKKSQFKAVGFDPGGNKLQVNPDWTVQPKELGKINAQGNFTAQKTGQGLIKASSQGVSSSFKIEVIPAPAVEIEVINDLPIQVVAGETTKLKLKAYDAQNNTVPNPNYNFSIEDQLGSVNQENLFKAHKAGQGLIKVTTGQAKEEIPVQVQVGPIKKIEVIPKQAEISAGSQLDFTAQALDQEGNLVKFRPQWSVVDDLGSISDDGVFSAKTIGQGLLICQRGNVSGVSKIKVNPGPVSQIKVHPDKLKMEAGNIYNLEATAYDDYDNITATEFTWNLQTNKQLGSFLAQGKFQAQKAGKDKIIASSGDVQGYCQIEIHPASVHRLVVPQEKVSLVSGQKIKLQAWGEDFYKNRIPVTGQWTVSPSRLGQIEDKNLFQAQKTGQGFLLVQFSGLESKISLEVNPGPLKNLKIQKPAETLQAGKSYHFEAIGLDQGGNHIPVEANWAATTDIGEIDPETGEFKAVQVGKGTIATYVQGIVDIAEIEIRPGFLNQIFLKPNPAKVVSNTTQQFQVSGVDVEGNEVKVPTLQWKVSGNIGYFEKPGLFVGTKQGQGKILAKIEDLQAEAYVTVLPGQPDMNNTRLRTERLSLPADGQTTSLIIIEVRDNHQNPVPGVTVRLTSSRQEDSIEQPSKTDNKGMSSGEISSNKPGKSEITAIIDQQKVKDTVTLDFVKPSS